LVRSCKDWSDKDGTHLRHLALEITDDAEHVLALADILHKHLLERTLVLVQLQQRNAREPLSDKGTWSRPTGNAIIGTSDRLAKGFTHVFELDGAELAKFMESVMCSVILNEYLHIIHLLRTE
jgi:hypothetical protein